MLFARGRFGLGTGTMCSHIGLEHSLRLFTFERHGLTVDTDFVPPLPGAAASMAYRFLLDGDLEWSGPTEGRMVPRELLGMPEHCYFGGRSRRAWRFRSSRRRQLVVDVLARADAMVREHPQPRLVRGSPALWGAVESYATTAMGDSDDDTSARHALALVNELVAMDLLPPAVASVFAPREDPALARIWSQVASGFLRLDTSVSFKTFALGSGLSLRTVSRLVRLAQDRLLVPPGHWRSLTGRYRLNLATMFLSCPDLSVREVAYALGYGDARALTHAFRNAGLPAPSAVRASMLDLRGELDDRLTG